MDELIIHEMPELRSPYLVVAFRGWPNAGEVASGVVGYLINHLHAHRFAEIAPDNFYNFTSSRPVIAIEDGLVKGLRFTSNEFFYWRNQGAEHDVVFLLGTEPHLRWREYVEHVLNMAKQLGVTRIYAVGGTYDQVPHTREPKLSSVVSSPHLQEEMRKLNVGFSNYSGPSSLHSTLIYTCAQRGIEAISLWGHAPHYIQVVGNPKVCHALVSRLCTLMSIQLELRDLQDASDYLDEALNKLLSENASLKEYVQKLEEEYEMEGQRASAPSEGTDRLIKDVEEFLRRESKRGGEGEQEK